MNTPNNKRSAGSREAIERAFIQLLDKQTSSRITVQSICTLAGLNRTTFYAHYSDVQNLQNKIEEKLSSQIKDIFENPLQSKSTLNDAFRRMFCFIKEHKLFYKTFLKYNNIYILKEILGDTGSVNNSESNTRDYHISFFTAGVSEMTRIWVNNDCRETPEQMAQIIYEEYRRA